MLDTLRHLLPDSTAWRLVVERTLKKYLRGVATVGSDVVAFVDDVYDDLWPDLTRELTEWLKQFGIDHWAWSNDDDMRDYLDFRWGEDRGQSPKHLQDKLRAAGFTGAYVYDSFDKHDINLTTYTGDTTGDLGLTALKGFTFAQNGALLYVADDIGDVIYQYTLASPYYLSTATYTGKSLQVTTWANPTDIHIRDDGLKLYVINFATDVIVEFDLTTPFDVSTGVFNQYGTDFTTQEATPQAMHFALDGTRVYITGTTSDKVHRFDMSVAWDVSTMSLVNSYTPSAVDGRGVTFTSDGLSMLLSRQASGSGHSVQHYTLSTAWDITSATSGDYIDLGSDVTDLDSVKLFGKYMFVHSETDGAVLKYRWGAWRDPLDYADQPLRGNTQCGETGASSLQSIPQCGEEPSSPVSQTSLDSAVCNQFLANEVWYLVNDTLTNDAPPSIPTDNSQWGPFWYVGGTPIGTELEVDEYDRQRFEKLCLKHGPAEAWIVTIIDIWQTTLLGTWAYELVAGSLDSGEWQMAAGAVQAKIHDTDADGTDQSTPLSGIASGDKLRFERSDDSTWIEYLTTGAASDQTTYWSILINTTPTAQSSDWTGFPSAGVNMQIYHRESV